MKRILDNIQVTDNNLNYKYSDTKKAIYLK